MILWVASGDNEYMQLTWLSLLDYREDGVVKARHRHKSKDYSVSATRRYTVKTSSLKRLQDK